MYELEITLNLNDFNSDYPKNPQTLGQQIRKLRMDKGMTAKEAGVLLGVSDTAVLNWEVKGKLPDESRMEKVNEFLAN